MRHIFLATPCFGGLITQSYMQSVIGCLADAHRLRLQLTLSLLGDDALITRARNTLLHQFMTKTDASHLLFVDGDIGFTAEDIDALLTAEKPVIGGAYPLKAHYWDDMTRKLIAAGEPPETASLRYVGECAALEDAGETTLARVSYIGTGFMLIRRDAVQEMIRAYPQTRYRRIDAPSQENSPNEELAYALFDSLIDPATGTYLSEDFAFCQRWRALDGEIWLHRGLRLTHTGATNFQGNPMIRHVSKNKVNYLVS
ncbi:hypothetical protein [Kozakia baliensis]|uniref:hypothetical protein n=1 Tax=Kozakia baliensis TaxID=153496 RepID=UPI00049801AE|nr:hypothetical protein [Kozakia baliensis]AOX21080.1 hypothetical protein A0U90_00615 [Kozakia baliensis]